MPLTSQNDADNNALAANTQVLGDEQASAAFSELEPSRQILVFRSIQEALEADPPRLQASFANCVAAYGAVEDVLEAGQTGQLDNDKLALPQQRVRSAGGCIAPGLKAEGHQSIAAFGAPPLKACSAATALKRSRPSKRRSTPSCASSSCRILAPYFRRSPPSSPP